MRPLRTQRLGTHLKIEKDNVVRFHYELKDESGNLVESSRERDPLLILQGRGNVVPGVDEALPGKAAGDRFEIDVAPEKAYGLYRKNQRQRVSKKYFRDGKRLKPGDQALLQMQSGARTVTVVKVGASVVDVDLNHPLAGQTVHFDIEVLEVREAEAEELAHGHSHGDGGHQH